MRIYDPCSGSGGMLILSKEYVEEHGGNARNLALFGQENNGGVWSISKMNLLLHGIPDADIRNADTLAEPLHTEGGELMRFDRVITNPPFSLNYTREGIPFPERFRYGWCPEGGKKADLMFVQHMISVLRPKGTVATVMPHGVLFRGGAEREIRKGLLDDDLLDAVIGLAPNLFYGTGIPACILVLRAKGAKPPERRGKVLFINADAEFSAGRAQNYLLPEHIEKIVSAYHAFADIPGYATRRHPRRAGRQRRQPQHPPLRRQRTTTRAARRSRPPRWRHPQARGRRQGRPLRCARLRPDARLRRARRRLLRLLRRRASKADLQTACCRPTRGWPSAKAS